PQTVQIVRQGEATLYWFKVNPLYQGGCLSRTLYRYTALNIGFNNIYCENSRMFSVFENVKMEKER
ncbi:hypothetical protein, partial [Neisseria sicca]|uniref:hypothetical protein n=1 Tax=Neisseria sicca TaxID=490 RepID=UPI0028EB3A44